MGIRHRRCALAMAAVLLVVPASAHVLIDPAEDTASAEADEPTDPIDLDSGLEEPDFEEPEPNLEEAVRMDTPRQSRYVEEIPVTGHEVAWWQKYPAAPSTAGDLQALRIEDITDLANYTPNLEINTAFAASSPTIFIRGIGLGGYNANALGSVAVYHEGVNINSPAIQLGQLFDIEGIDVLRGGPRGASTAATPPRARS